jgi:hypothetical protein
MSNPQSPKPVIPSGAESIAVRADGTLEVPDRPIIPFIEGDGTGPDIWRASVRVLDAAVAPIVGFLIYQDVGRHSRELIPELGAALALASSIAVVALADGFTATLSAALWAAMVARLVPSVLYVRERIKLEKGKPFDQFWSHFAHIAALVLVGTLYYFSLGSSLTVLMSAFLAGRAVYGLSGSAPKMTAKVLGVREVIYGVLYALTLVVGYYAGI